MGGARYLHTIAAIQAAAAIAGLTAGQWLPHPLAVMTIVGSITAAITCVFIAPTDTPEDT